MHKVWPLAILLPLLGACAIGQSEGPPAVLITNSNLQTTQSTTITLILDGVAQPPLVVPARGNLRENLPASANACIVAPDARLGYRFQVDPTRHFPHPYTFVLQADGQTVTEFSQGDPTQGATPTNSCP